MNPRERKRNWLWVTPAMVVPLIGSLVYFVWFSDSEIGKAAYGATKVFTLVLPALWWLIHERDKGPGRPGDPHTGSTRRRAVHSILPGIVSGLAIGATAFALMATPLGDIISNSAGAVRSKATSLGFADHFLLFAVFISVIHSAIEEIYWRWFVFGRLRELIPLKSAHILAAIAFSAHHLVITLQFFPTAMAVFLAISVGVGGALWSWLYNRHHSLVGAWISHMIVDLALMRIGYGLIFP